MYDAIIVGARCAGAATALLLARRGQRVLLLDRARFPSEIPHGHLIHRGGPARLSRWGMLARVLSSGCPAIDTYVLEQAGVALVGRNLSVDGVAFGVGPRRKVIDQILIQAAIEAGAEFRDGFSVDDVLRQGEDVVGIVGREAGQPARFSESGRLIIGADGRNSRLARLVGAAQYGTVPPLTCWYFSYWSGAFEQALALRARDRTVIFSFPTNDRLHAILVAWPAAEFQRVRHDIEGNFLEVVRRAPDLAASVEAGHREERFYGTADVPNFYRRPFGPGWALVGDAGCTKDPYLALGMSDALRDAELLADAAHAGLAGLRPMDEALAAYEAARNAASAADYGENVQAARLQPVPEERRALLAALHGHDEDIRQFLLVRQRLIPADQFFNPQNLQRIMGGLESAAPSR
jgi:flavin-dependent dehydrogenase